MDKIYAPWREKYIDEKGKSDTCAFCEQLKKNDDSKFYILKRYKHTFVMLNLYPYNGGHLMILPIAHKATLGACTPEERAELIEVVNKSVTMIEKTLAPEGFNIGLNTGRAGGGGIPSHLHIHVLPRWEGDTNFMATLSNTKPVSVDLNDLFNKLKEAFN